MPYLLARPLERTMPRSHVVRPRTRAILSDQVAEFSGAGCVSLAPLAGSVEVAARPDGQDSCAST